MKYTRAEVIEIASNLFDGGWRAADYNDLISEYDFTGDECNAICDTLAVLEWNANKQI